MADVDIIPIDKIDPSENAIRFQEGDFSQLMDSIRQHGLLQPIGLRPKHGKPNHYEPIWGYRRLAAVKKLGWTHLQRGQAVVLTSSMTEVEYRTLNAIENIHRKDLDAIEEGRDIDWFHNDQGLSLKEVAVRLSIPVHRVENNLKIFTQTPLEARKHLSPQQGLKGHGKGVSATAAINILMRGLPKETTTRLFEAARKGSYNTAQAKLLATMVHEGMDVDKAIKELENYRYVMVDIVVVREVSNNLERRYSMSIQDILRLTLLDEIKLPKGLILRKSKPIQKVATNIS